MCLRIRRMKGLKEQLIINALSAIKICIINHLNKNLRLFSASVQNNPIK
jgi:hypothetical protein